MMWGVIYYYWGKRPDLTIQTLLEAQDLFKQLPVDADPKIYFNTYTLLAEQYITKARFFKAYDQLSTVDSLMGLSDFTHMPLLGSLSMPT